MSTQRVNIDELELEFARILDKYAVRTAEVSKQIVEQTATDTVNQLKQTSPNPSKHNVYSPKLKYKDGDYARSWKWSRNAITRGRWYHSVVVFNEKHYRLTHLLENGHDLVSKTGKLYGRVKGQPHIITAEEIARDEMEKNMIDALSNIGFD